MILTYYLWYNTLWNNRILINELWEYFVNEWILKNKSDISNYWKNEIDKFVEIVRGYSQNDFNEFLDSILNYIKYEFDAENYFYLSFQVFRYFICANSFDEKFNNAWIIKRLEDLSEDIMKNSNNDFVKFFSWKWFLIYADKLKKLQKELN